MMRSNGLTLAVGLLLVASAHAWTPKYDSVSYSPKRVDWSSLISACRTVGRHERRLFNFMVRLAFHDGGALNQDACAKGDEVACGGLDGSVFLSEEEFKREENAHDGLSDITFKVIRRIAAFYDASVADTLAVCSSVAVQELSRHRVKLIGRLNGKPDFLVGRLDSKHTAPEHSLPAADMTAPEFADFWPKLGLTVEEGVALLGSHSLLEIQGCRRGARADDMCDPDKERCDDIRMFKWNNAYYKDMCTPNVQMKVVPFQPDTPVKDLSEKEYKQLQKTNMCRWTSQEHRDRVLSELEDERQGKVEEHGPNPKKMHKITWKNQRCTNPKDCPHTETWEHTVNDAYLAQACQGKAPNKPKTNAIKIAMQHFKEDQDAWDKVFTGAWLKLLSKRSRFAHDKPLAIDGRECISSYILDDSCMASLDSDEASDAKCNKCNGPNQQSCHRCCICPTAFHRDGVAWKRDGKTSLTKPYLPKA